MVNGFTAVVHGHVQGVGFRYFVKTRALELNVTGFVRNASDGNVEIEAFGPDLQLEQLLHYIKAGPVGSSVEDVAIQWFQMESASKTFEIRG